MRNRLARVLTLEIGNRVIFTGRWDYRLGSLRNCFNAHGFRGVTVCGAPLLLWTRRLSGSPHFPFPANSPLVDSPRRKWLLRRSRVSVGATGCARCRLGVLIEFDSKNHFVLDLDSGDCSPAVSSRAAYFNRTRSGLSIQPVS